MQKLLAVVAVAVAALSVATARAQESTAASTVTPAAVSASAPQLGYGASQILQLAQAKVGDDTIIAFIKNSGNSYGLNADQIIYLKQQGISGAVITTMLSQPRAGVAPAAVPPAVATAGPEPVSTATVAPTVTYVQTVPVTSYYYQPYYYPVYDSYPAVSLSLGWGNYWGGGYYYGGGYYGGGYRGGVYYGGGGHGGGGYQGGGFHGGGGFSGGRGGGGVDFMAAADADKIFFRKVETEFAG